MIILDDVLDYIITSPCYCVCDSWCCDWEVCRAFQFDKMGFDMILESGGVY